MRARRRSREVVPVSKRKLVGRVGWLKPGAIFWTEKTDGGPFRMLRTDEPAKTPGGPHAVFQEGTSFAEAVRVSDGGLVSLDATHLAWTLAPKRRQP